MTSAIKNKTAFLEQMRKRFLLAEESLQVPHAEALEDWKCRLGDQWDSDIEARRKADGRPCWTINRVPQFIRQLTGEQRKNRPAIEVSPVGDGADVETSDIIQGVVRHIERISNAEEAVDTAFEHMVTGGFGFIRLITDFVNDSFDQEIKFQREPNPFAHYPDPRAKEPDYSDARYWFVISDMDADDFREEFAESQMAQLSDFSTLADEAPDWVKRDSVRLAEYYWVEIQREEISKGKRKRSKEKRIVHWCLTNGVEILDETVLPGEYIPIIPVLGEEVTVAGKKHLIGIVRYMRAPQALYNLWQSAMAETIALAPKVPYQVTPTQIEGFEDLYEQAHSSNLPYLPYNPDPKAPGPPSRTVVEPPIQAITVAIKHADNDLHATTGLYDASLGSPGPDQSGKAILLRQKQGDSATFAFQDSLPRALKHAGRIIVSWIPAIYDAERVVRIINPDGTSKTVPINQPFEDDDGVHKVYDLTVGRYDVAISTGPSFDTMREEAAQSMLGLVQAQPELMSVIGDLLVRCFDWPMAQEISDRLKKLLPPALQENNPNAQVPPQVQAKIAAQTQMIEQMTASLHRLSAQLESKQVEAASRERIALIQSRAAVVQALIRAQSQESIIAFQAELEQIDRQLAQIPDPAAQPAVGDPAAAATGGGGAPVPAGASAGAPAPAGGDEGPQVPAHALLPQAA